MSETQRNWGKLYLFWRESVLKSVLFLVLLVLNAISARLLWAEKVNRIKISRYKVGCVYFDKMGLFSNIIISQLISFFHLSLVPQKNSCKSFTPVVVKGKSIAYEKKKEKRKKKIKIKRKLLKLVMFRFLLFSFCCCCCWNGVNQ